MGLAAVGLAMLTSGPASGAGTAESRHELQQQQLQDTLDLDLRQSASRARRDLEPADALRLEQMQLRQRLQQQQLQQHQLQQQRLQHGRADINGDIQQRLFAQQRELQIQRFDMEQRELLRTMPARPLQRPSSPGQLRP